jgi:long-chain fatty acid transport protein
MRRLALLLAVAAVLDPRTGDAAGFAIVEQSALAGGTAGAGVARAWDPAAAWYNPAALAGRAGLSAAAGLLVLAPTLQATATDGAWTGETSSPPRTPPYAYVSAGWGPFAGGLAFNVPFGSSVVWPESWEGRYVTVSSQLQVMRLSPFVAWRFFRRLGVSAGLHVDFATLALRRRLDFIDTEGSVAVELRQAGGLGGHASLYLDVASWLSVGATYKSRTTLALEGEARFEAPPPFAAKTTDQRAAAAYHLPDLIVIGAEVRPHPRWSAVLDLGITVWSVYDQLFVDFEREETTDVRQRAEWSTRVSVRGGAEFRPLSWLATRLGLLYDPTPVPADTLAPSSPDSHRVGVSLGLGARLPFGISVDAFYSYVHFLGQQSTATETLAATYGGRLHVTGVGLRYELAR